MARAKSPKQTAQASYAAPTENDKSPTIQIAGMNGTELVEMLNRQIKGSEAKWEEKPYKLRDTTKENEKWYYGWQNEESDDDKKKPDNRIFSALRTVVPYTTTRITEPEAYPSSNEAPAKRFSQDFEKALHIKADEEEVKEKLRYALEDAIVRRRGYLKPRYDPITGNFCKVEYVPCESIIIDHKSKPGEEPRYFRHLLDKTVEDLIVMFPEMEQTILDAFNLDKNATRAAMQQECTLNEDWSFVRNEENQLDLIVCWNYKGKALHAAEDPNWRYEDTNFLPYHMMPLVPVNVLSDGRSYIDKTSYVEQAMGGQQTIDERDEQISDNAGLGSVGMPVVDSEALDEEQAQYLTYEEDTVIQVKLKEGQKINDVFTTWKAQPLSSDVYKNREDAIATVQNAFGASAVQQGNDTDSNTLGQDEMLRDQSMGRQQEIVDAVDRATKRLYLFIAQFLLVYGTEEELFTAVGENSEFDFIMMNSNELDTGAKIRVKAGTSMPIDHQKRQAIADKAAGQTMIDPLSYWEIMDEPNAQKIAKRVVDYNADPTTFMADTQEDIFDRNAYVDLELLQAGQQPPFRETLDKQYFDYLNKFILDGRLESPNLTADVKLSISEFINMQLARGQQMLGMAETQLPTTDDVNAYNTQIDQQNQADAGAIKAASDTNGAQQKQAQTAITAKSKV